MFPRLAKISRTRLIAVAAFIAVASLPILAQESDLGDSAKQQIAEILQQKRSFNAAERKISSHLVFANRANRQQMSRSVSHLVDTARFGPRGMVEVDIKGEVNEALLGLIVAVGGEVQNSTPEYGAVRAILPLRSLERVAQSNQVSSIDDAEPYLLNNTIRPSSSPVHVTGMPKGPRFVERRAAAPVQPTELPLLAANGVLPSLSSWFSLRGLSFFVGALTSQGYISHTANQVVAMGINGTGVKVGVLSDSASAARVAALMGTGDLGPGTTVLPGLGSSGTDEGTAMMEIVQDLAPGAQIYFATANGGQAAMAANIASLAAAGCTIIVDDITYLAEAAFQDGPIAQAVNTFTTAGGLYFSAAANSGNLSHGTSGTWEGDFLNGGAVTSGPIFNIEGAGFFHNFGTAGSPVLFDTMTVTTTFISLKWSDPIAGSGNDYDLFITNSTGATVKGFSAAAQTGTQNPFEAVQQGSGCGTASPSGYCPAAGDRIYIILFSGSARALRLDMNRGQISINTAGSTYGHNGGPSTLTVAATAWNSAHAGTKPFTGFANPTEVFSSDGPRKMFFNADGTPITPGNFLFGTNGGTTFQKPDFTAADGVSAKTPGFNPFFGTSAAAPHAAAVAALVKSAKPSLTGPQIRTILINTALDNMAIGVDRDGGYGIVMAKAAVTAALP
ncbi:MAG TPA: S8 family serine peptidase [Bryobacteraceae bacterium]